MQCLKFLLAIKIGSGFVTLASDLAFDGDISKPNIIGIYIHKNDNSDIIIGDMTMKKR